MNKTGGIGRSKKSTCGDSQFNKSLNSYNAKNGIPLEYHAANFPRIKLDKINIGKLVKILLQQQQDDYGNEIELEEGGHYYNDNESTALDLNLSSCSESESQYEEDEEDEGN